MHIRPARLDDAPAMARVIVDTFMQTNQGIMSEEALRKRAQTWTYEVSAQNWRDTMLDIASGVTPLACLYVAVDESDEVVGFAWGYPVDPEQRQDVDGAAAAGPTTAEIDVLYVRADHQGRGIGGALVQTVAADLAGKGMTSLHIATPAATPQSRRFYEALGGRVIGTRQDHEDGEIVDLVVYGWPDIRTLLAAPGG